MRLLFFILVPLLLGNLEAPEPTGGAHGGPSIASHGSGKSATQHQGSERNPVAVRLVKSPEERTDAERGDQIAEQHEREDLAAQQLAADAADRQAGLALPALVISGIGTFLVLIALGLTWHSNWIARDTARRQLRAYVELDHAALERVDGNITRVCLQVKNTGQTPAENVAFHYSVKGGTTSPEYGFFIPEPMTTPPSSGRIGGQQVRNSAYDFDGGLKSEHFQWCLDNGGSIYVFGTITYADIFRNQHRLPFRVEIDAAGERERKGRFSYCAEGNG